jgi:hypothetical protein
VPTRPSRRGRRRRRRLDKPPAGEGQGTGAGKPTEGRGWTNRHREDGSLALANRWGGGRTSYHREEDEVAVFRREARSTRVEGQVVAWWPPAWSVAGAGATELRRDRGRPDAESGGQRRRGRGGLRWRGSATSGGSRWPVLGVESGAAASCSLPAQRRTNGLPTPLRSSTMVEIRPNFVILHPHCPPWPSSAVDPASPLPRRRSCPSSPHWHAALLLFLVNVGA